MGNINYGYFRHRFDARNDDKVQGLMDKYGVSGIGYYYILLEIYGSYYSKLEEGDVVKIHKRVLIDALRSRSDTCHNALTYMHSLGLIEVQYTSNTYSLRIPNFPKYYGSYSRKPPNKRKGKERKVNNITSESLDSFLDSVKKGDNS